MWGWFRGCTPPQEWCRLPPTYFWVTWDQPRAILISVKNKKRIYWLVWQLWKKRRVWSFERMQGWSCCCIPPQECCRLPPTYFCVPWHQRRAILLSMNNEKCFIWQVWQFWKRRRVWAFWELAGLIPWLHSTSGMLQTIAYLLFHHMAPN